MKFFLLAALPALVAAQNYGPPAAPASSSSATSTAPAAVPTPTSSTQHFVQVGANDLLTFSPNVITTQPNDTVTFFFSEFGGTVMHGVVESSFATPCEMLPGGLASGLQSTGSQWTITITNTSQPIWLFCPQTMPAVHCNKAMVAVINPPADHSITDFSAEAVTGSESATFTSLALTGIGAFASAPPAIPSSASAAPSSSSTPSSATRLIAGAASLLAGLFAAAYTLA